MKLYAVKDVLVGSFMPPVAMQNDEVAVRAMKIAANDPNSFKENKKDVQLWFIADWNPDTGVISNNEPYCIGNIIDFIEVKNNE